ncbi:MAG: DUF385 domain-containing protein [Pseudomonadales bacterium]|nr:DUF385 domain-containing protein [Pseudomonadales bacterium]
MASRLHVSGLMNGLRSAYMEVGWMPRSWKTWEVASGIITSIAQRNSRSHTPLRRRSRKSTPLGFVSIWWSWRSYHVVIETVGRPSGEDKSTPLLYQRVESGFLVVASNCCGVWNCVNGVSPT